MSDEVQISAGVYGHTKATTDNKPLHPTTPLLTQTGSLKNHDLSNSSLEHLKTTTLGQQAEAMQPALITSADELQFSALTQGSCGQVWMARHALSSLKL